MKLVLIYHKYNGHGGELKVLPFEYESIRYAKKDFLAAANLKKDRFFTFLGEGFYLDDVCEFDGKTMVYFLKQYNGPLFLTLAQWFEDNKMAY